MKCIVMCSGKGGTGKSCVAAYTGAALAGAGMKTLLVELGRDARSLDLILGVRDCAFGALDVLAGHCEADEAIAAVESLPGLFLLPAGDGEQPRNGDALRSLLEPLDGQYDFIIVDGADLAVFPTRLCDIFLLVTTPDSLSVRACADTAGTLFRAGARDVRLVINSVPPRVIPIDGAEDFDDVIDKIGAQLIAVIPASQKLSHCSNNARPLDPDSLTVNIYDNLAGRLMGQHRPLLIR